MDITSKEMKMNDNSNENQVGLNGYLRLPKVLELIPIAKSSWWKGVKQGRYPKPVSIGIRTKAWKVEDIRKLIRSFNEQ